METAQPTASAPRNRRKEALLWAVVVLGLAAMVYVFHRVYFRHSDHVFYCNPGSQRGGHPPGTERQCERGWCPSAERGADTGPSWSDNCFARDEVWCADGTDNNSARCAPTQAECEAQRRRVEMMNEGIGRNDFTVPGPCLATRASGLP